MPLSYHTVVRLSRHIRNFLRIIYKFFHIIECRNILCGEEVESEMGMKVKVSRGAVFMVIGMLLLEAVEVWRGGLIWGTIWAGVFPWLVIATAVLIHAQGWSKTSPSLYK